MCVCVCAEERHVCQCIYPTLQILNAYIIYVRTYIITCCYDDPLPVGIEHRG